MPGKPLRIICTGRLKTPFFRAACEHYLTRLRHWRQVDYTETRDGAASLPAEKRNREEARHILKALAPQDIPLMLDEGGESLSSTELAALIRQMDTNASGRPCFIIGGAFGLTETLRAEAYRLVSLSRLTLPHELARVLLLEQPYRAESILRNTPYHH